MRRSDYEDVGCGFALAALLLLVMLAFVYCAGLVPELVDLINVFLE